MTTMLADPPTKAPHLGVGLDAKGRRAPNADAWKQAIGTKQIPARLALLPEEKRRWDRLGVSAGVQVAILIFFLIIPLFYPDRIKTALNYEVVSLAQPVVEIPVAAPPPKIRPKVAPPKTQVIEPVKLNPKQPHIFVTPKALQPKVAKIEAKAPELTPVFEAAKLDVAQPGPKKPREDVKVNVLATGSAAPATVKLPPEKVQTGGFGDPNGLAGKGDPTKGHIVNRQGSPLLPGGPGYGNGTGGDKGARGTVASTGFGNGTAIAPQGGAKRGAVQTSGFGDQTVAAEAPKKKAASTDGATSQVDILEKPRPEYTAEGRSLKLEGDVTLDVVFLASGAVEVNRVVSGLGHGLDEAASKAARQIKFRPAKRDGQPVDFPARVRIEFRLAY